MPKIPCTLRTLVGQRYFPFVTYFLASSRLSRPIDAIVDTGSPWTVISTNDLLSTRLPLHAMQKGQTLQLAGFKFFRYTLPNVTMSFKTESGGLFKGTLAAFGALVPTKLDKQTLMDVRNIPSIIGHDFLEENKVAFYFNASSKIAYLEVPEAPTTQNPS